MMNGMVGIGVRRNVYGHRVITAVGRSSRDGPSLECNAAVYIDGIRILEDRPLGPPASNAKGLGVAIDELVSPSNVAGIEVYTRPSEVPHEFEALNASCAVVLVWTKRGV
jgi:hypothetical protein